MVLVRAMHIVSLVKSADMAPQDMDTSHKSLLGVSDVLFTNTLETNLGNKRKKETRICQRTVRSVVACSHVVTTHRCGTGKRRDHCIGQVQNNR